MYRRPGYGGRSKASADTLCQKCLKRDIYECTATAQERPYKSRPSRTQQLLNPQLKPKLSTEVPNDLLRRKGVADEILAKKEEERGRKSSRDHSKSSRRHSRSVSSYSSASVSTISTNRSPSRSLSPSSERNGKPSRGGKDTKLGKRGRRSMSSESYGSDASRTGAQAAERHTRRRLSSFSPEKRGRRRTRSKSSRMEMSHDNDDASRRGRGYRRLSRSRSYSRDKARPRLRSRSRESQAKQSIRRFSVSRSRSRSLDRMDTSEDHGPTRNGDARAKRDRWGASPSAQQQSAPRSRSRGARRRWSRSRSPYRGGRSPSPFSQRRQMRSPSPYKGRNGTRGRNGPSGGDRSRQFEGRRPDQEPRNGRLAQPQPQRERSLSPYSKRVAMTKVMQAGR